jgi:hypothetical protein
MLQIPPGSVAVRLLIKPAHTLKEPPIVGTGLTVSSCIAIQPVGSVYVMVTTPESMPDTVPVPSMVATVTSLLLHVPPAAMLSSTVPEPVQIAKVPVIADGNGFTVTSARAIQPVGKV